MFQQTQRRKRLPILIVAVGVGVLLIAGGMATFSSQEKAVAVAVASTQTAMAPTATNTMTVTPSETPTITLTPTNTSTGTLLPTFTPTLTFTPSPTPVPPKPPKPNADGYATPVEAPPTAIPTPVQPVPVPEGVVNVMLLGSDTREGAGGDYRTDSIIIVSINRNAGTVNMLSLPRDLYVYIPGWTMNRINTAATHGSSVGWQGGGPGLLKDTLLYNFGITVHYYARVEFDSFKEIVDIMGGVDVPVDCAIQGFRLKSPRRQYSDFSKYDDWVAYTADESNWEIYTLPVGVQHLDGYMALWYARLRQGVAPGKSYTDYDRARRQQQVLRSILSQARSVGLVPRIPELWMQYNDLVETDMGLGNMLQLAPIATNIDNSKINSYILTPDLLISWTVPTDGASVSLPSPGAVEQLVTIAMQPPSENYLSVNTVKVEVRNGTPGDRLDEVAADRIIREGGMLVVPTGFADNKNYAQTVIYDFTGSRKATQLQRLQRLLRVADKQVIVQPDPNRAFDYVIILGTDYQNRTCTYNVPIPVEPTTSTPEATSAP
ncbi:MAG: LCP family protein [Anaerolineae bacterium]|nr:LCP family protein [Anaerolineae bacterium]